MIPKLANMKFHSALIGHSFQACITSNPGHLLCKLLIKSPIQLYIRNQVRYVKPPPTSCTRGDHYYGFL